MTFARKPYKPAKTKLEPIPLHLRRNAVFARLDVPAQPQPKFEYVRSKPLLIACREIPCQHCGIADGTVVAAHSNQSRHGKGRSVKASDVFVASLCHKCHSDLDQGSGMTRNEREAMWDSAHRNTVKTLVRRGLWPLDVEVPETRRMN